MSELIQRAARIRAGDLPALLAAAAAPFAPGLAAPLLLAAALGLWLGRGLGRYERLLVAVPWLAALAALTALALAPPAPTGAPGTARVERLVRDQLGELFETFEGAAGGAARRLRGPIADRLGHQEAFTRLAEVAAAGPPRLSYLLLDPDGNAVAWAGEGLVHDLENLEIEAARRVFRTSLSAVTMASVEALDWGRRPWAVVVGRSLPTDDLPRPIPGAGPLRWSLVEAEEPAAAGKLRVSLGAGPSVVVDLGSARAEAGAAAPWLKRLGGGLVALGLFAFGAARLTRPGGARAPAARRAALPALAVASAATLVLLWALGLEAGAAAAAGLAAAAALALWALAAAAPRLHPAVAGPLAGALPLAAALAIERLGGPVDLGSRLGGTTHEHLLRLAAFALVLGVLSLAAGRGRAGSPPAGSRWAWASLAVLVAAGAALDLPWAALPLVVAGASLAALWARSRPARPGASALAALCLLAALIAAVGWEAGHRVALRGHLEKEVLPEMAPPSTLEIEEITLALDAALGGTDLSAIALRDPRLLDLRDLAFALWRRSPLATKGALSAIQVEGFQGERSSFSFGLPVLEEGVLDRSPTRWEQLRLSVRESALVEGETELSFGGERWGLLRYWMLLRPGFRLATGPIEGLAEGLLRGEPVAYRPPAGVLQSAHFALYDRGGEVLLSPWSETPPLAALPGRGATVETPAGSAFVFREEGEEGVRTLFLPRLAPAAAIERVGTHALGLVVALAVLLAAGLLLTLRLGALRRTIRRALRSYSKRLPIVYSLLALAPLLALNLVVLRIVGLRLEREQLENGAAAVESAQHILGDYVLSLDPGFGIDTALDDELLIWLSRVVHREFNLYWGSSVYASSKRELFTAGLLPERIPGEIYARLALREAEFASRTNRAGGSTYLELYAPIEIPGVSFDLARLFVSMPLLAQEVEVAEELAALRRKVILVTAALALLLAAVGVRLARNFTEPLMEIVEGTQRIAAGAASLDLAPTELELATLVDAIDRMAERIADGRRTLMREKALVERMIENITAGVVSVDSEGRVLMLNRVAGRLLEVEVGDRLAEAVAGVERLEAVAKFLDRAGDLPATVGLEDPDGGEREWTLIWVPLPGGGEPSALLVVEDVTEVLRGQRLAAWAEMARIIAHEIKNPLTPIRLSAEHMRQVWETDRGQLDEVFERCTRNILRQVDELQQISGEFSVYSRIPRIDLQPGDLVGAVAEVVEAYRAAPPVGIEIEFSARPPEIPAAFDGRLLGRAVRNLIENALRATAGGGRVRITVESNARTARVRVADTGPGVDPHVLTRIFDPYFSTYDSGTGLGLPIARRIVEEHGGGVHARNLPEGGLEVEITIPTEAKG